MERVKAVGAEVEENVEGSLWKGAWEGCSKAEVRLERGLEGEHGGRGNRRRTNRQASMLRRVVVEHGACWLARRSYAFLAYKREEVFAMQ